MNRFFVATVALAVLSGCAQKGSKGAAGPAGVIGLDPIVPAAPQIASISPEFASPAMQVTIAGTGFGTTPEVLVGGAPANIVSASSTSIVINPPAFAALDQNGQAPVVVHASGLESSPFPFRLGQPGDYNGPNLIQFQPSSGDLVVMANGNIVLNQARFNYSYGGLPVIVDPTRKISSNLYYNTGLSSPVAMRPLDTNNVLVLDGGTGKIMKYNVTTGDVSVFRALASYYGWVDFTIEGNFLYVLWGSGYYIEKIDLTTGSDDPYFANSYNYGTGAYCFYTHSLEAINGTLYVANYYVYPQYYGYPAACSINEMTGVANPVTFTGATPDSIGQIRADGVNMAITGQYSGQGFVATGVITGNTAATTISSVPYQGNYYFSAGLNVLGAGEYLVSTYDAIFQVNATTSTLKAATPANSGALGLFTAASGKIFVVSNLSPAIITEVDPATGGIRGVASRAVSGNTFFGLDGDATYLYVAGNVGGTFEIDQVTIADGTITPLVTGLASISDFARDAAGNIYVVNGTTNVAQYDGQGALVNATFATLTNGGSKIVRHGTSFYFIAGNEIDTVTVAAGGAATRVNTPDLVNGQLVSFDPAGGMLVIDDGTLYTVTVEGFFKPWLVNTFSDPRSLTIQPDGELLVADGNLGFGLLLP